MTARARTSERPGPREPAFVVERRAVERLRTALAAARELYEPLPGAGGVEWQRASAERALDWRAPLPLASPKRFFFPAREALLRWKGASVEATIPDPPPFVLLGLRACDLAAIAYQDRFFAGDAAYETRRRRALLVGVNCLCACPGGFCREVDAGPFAAGGFDLCLTEISDGKVASGRAMDGGMAAGRVVVEVGSDAGREALEAIAADLRPIDPEVREAFCAARAGAQASFPRRAVVAHAIERIDRPVEAGGVSDAEWHALGPSCFACTGCTNLCPTCSCFTVVDEPHPATENGGAAAGKRVRLWDSCLLEGFQREASGHHPAPEPGDRVRRFWFHKLSRTFAGFDRLGCVGCGRCDVTCPGSIGAMHVLAALGAGGDGDGDGGAPVTESVGAP